MKDNINETYLETTSLDHGHLHTYFMDKEGNGETLKTITLEGDVIYHIHKIENYQVLETHDHIHYIKYECVEDEVEEVEEINDEKIKEMSIILNTGMNTTVEYITEHINGKLIGIIIDTDRSIGVNITLERFNDISIFKKVDFHGQKYLSLINDATFSNNEKSQSSNQNWYLNDKLRLHIEGSIDTTIKLVIRYC